MWVNGSGGGGGRGGGGLKCRFEIPPFLWECNGWANEGDGGGDTNCNKERSLKTFQLKRRAIVFVGKVVIILMVEGVPGPLGAAPLGGLQAGAHSLQEFARADGVRVKQQALVCHHNRPAGGWRGSGFTWVGGGGGGIIMAVLFEAT
jgi:hypothetical protein